MPETPDPQQTHDATRACRPTAARGAPTHLLRREGELIGRDENGNSYYESSEGKRWVIYGNVSEPTTIPPAWHIWLHYTDNAVPVNNNKRKTPNLTGTKDAYYPNQKVKNYYKSWNPNN